jgi:hypothetical protein
MTRPGVPASVARRQAPEFEPEHHRPRRTLVDVPLAHEIAKTSTGQHVAIIGIVQAAAAADIT